MKVDDAIQQREDLSAKSGDIAHGVVVGVQDREEVVLPGSVDEGPGHEGQKWDMEVFGAEIVDVFGEDGEGACDAEDRERLA